jgi:peptide-methionine (R)-S-oxide reductase
VREEADASLPLFPRVEVRCARCESHQGYVFADGPPERSGGTRFCVNGAGLTFTPAA